MSALPSADGILDYIASESLAAARDWPWVLAPLTHASGRAYILQHVLRNRFFSSVMRPAWMSRCPDMDIVRKTIGQMHEELVLDTEPLRLYRRLQILSGLEHEQIKTIFPGDTGAGCSDGLRT